MGHIHVVIQVMEKPAECSKLLYMAFVDYEKVFDTIDIATVLEVLKEQGIKETYMGLLGDM